MKAQKKTHSTFEFFSLRVIKASSSKKPDGKAANQWRLSRTLKWMSVSLSKTFKQCAGNLKCDLARKSYFEPIRRHEAGFSYYSLSPSCTPVWLSCNTKKQFFFLRTLAARVYFAGVMSDEGGKSRNCTPFTWTIFLSYFFFFGKTESRVGKSRKISATTEVYIFISDFLDYSVK